MNKKTACVPCKSLSEYYVNLCDHCGKFQILLNRKEHKEYVKDAKKKVE